MLQDVVKSNIVSLVPYTGIQFLDIGINLDELKYFASYCTKNESGDKRLLKTAEDERTGKIIDSEGQQVDEDNEIKLNLNQILNTYDRSWLPLPLHRIKEESNVGKISFDQGPLNWARFRVAALDNKDNDGHTHRITIVIDTNLLTHHPNRPYAAPSPNDVTTASQFSLAGNLADIEWINREEWSSSIIEDAYDNYLVNRFGIDRFEIRKQTVHPLEQWANYVSLIEFLKEEKAIPRIHFIDTVSEPKQYNPVSVDLVLDMGNSRTCGILIESSGKDDIDLNNSYTLELRDLSEAEKVYKDPFPSVIEFHQESFGNNRLTARSRGDAFQWPTPARVGWEANRLFNYSRNTDGNTGLSSPKRYLWDTREQSHDWYFNSFGNNRDNPNRTPAIKGNFFKILTNAGEEWDKDDPTSSCVTRANYTKSSMMMFYLAEVFAQALMQINSYSQRRKKSHTDLPRKFSRIILTMPTAMALSERRIFEKRAKLALKSVLDVMKIPSKDCPRLIMQWDESTGTQAVFLYNEIKENYRGNASQFFAASSRRFREENNNKIRIASIDVGGGTSDLIITTYHLTDGRLIKPNQEFREGFNIAGDDILCAIIERHVLPAIKKYIEESGVPEADILMTSLFGASRANEDEREHIKRRLFCNQISLQVGLRIIGIYEHYDAAHDNTNYELKYSDIFDSSNEPRDVVFDYLESAVRDHGGTGFSLKQVVFDINLESINNTVKRTISAVLKDLCELIYHYSCDYVLLSGRPSMMPGVRDSIISKMPTPVDRIIPMHNYKVGAWYPFRDLRGKLSDPKTTAAVGALVCALSNGYLVGFHLKSDAMTMKSTANYIGLIEDTGQIKNANLYFKDINLDTALHHKDLPARQGYLSAEMLFSGPMFIGFRQMNVERWPGTLLYRVDFNDRENVARLDLPLKITIGLIPEDQDNNCKIFDVEMVEDAQGQGKSNSTVKFRLQTMRADSGYWMDTGVFMV